MPGANRFASLLYEYFYSWLGPSTRDCSPHTRRAYTCTWRMLNQHVAAQKGIKLRELELEDFTRERILAFLNTLEATRHNATTTRNCRLAAIRAFFAFVEQREPAALRQCQEVLSIPSKKTWTKEREYLTDAEVLTLLSQPNQKTFSGQRDHALFYFLYTVGARIEEALALDVGALHLAAPLEARLMGKGRKQRIVPLTPEAAVLLRALIDRSPAGPTEAVFRNARGYRLTPSGARFRLRLHLKQAAYQCPSLAAKRVSPHVFRHTNAVALLRGSDVTVVKAWLGHARLATTEVYCHTDPQRRREALARVRPSLVTTRVPRWKEDPSLLTWLESLSIPRDAT